MFMDFKAGCHLINEGGGGTGAGKVWRRIENRPMGDKFLSFVMKTQAVHMAGGNATYRGHFAKSRGVFGQRRTLVFKEFVDSTSTNTK
jgi:hypothetical protein